MLVYQRVVFPMTSVARNGSVHPTRSMRGNGSRTAPQRWRERWSDSRNEMGSQVDLLWVSQPHDGWKQRTVWKIQFLFVRETFWRLHVESTGWNLIFLITIRVMSLWTENGIWLDKWPNGFFSWSIRCPSQYSCGFTSLRIVATLI